MNLNKNIERKEKEIAYIDRLLKIIRTTDEFDLLDYLIDKKAKLIILLTQYKSNSKKAEQNEKA